MENLKLNMSEQPVTNTAEPTQYVVTTAAEHVFEKAMNRIADVAENISNSYFEHQETKMTIEADIEKENIKSQRQLNLISVALLAVILIIGTVVVIFIKDIPPALNSILCFVAGYAATAIRGFVIQKGEQRQRPKE